jgi:hypothetical protein
MDFWGRLGLSTLSGGVVGGVFSVAQGGKFWNGFAAGAGGAAAGFLGNELGEYLKRTKVEREFAERVAEIDENTKAALKDYGLGPIEVHEITKQMWDEIEGVFKDFNLPWEKSFRTRDLDTKAVMRFGKMHIRFGTEAMTHRTDNGKKYNAYKLNKGAGNVHYDRFDPILNPILHVLFDSWYQGWFKHVW